MKSIIFTLLFIFCSTAFGQISTTPDPILVSAEAVGILIGPEGEIVELGYVAKSAIDLIKNYQGMGKLALAMALINLLMSLLKTKYLSGWLKKQSPGMKRLLLVALGQFAGVIIMIEAGISPLSAVLAGLLTSGGASAIYDAAKPVLAWYKERKSK